MMTEEITPEALISKKNTAPVAFTKLTLLIDKYGEDVIYCFVEGYDMPYYIPPVRFILEKEPVGIICGGKDNVINANRFIEDKSEYSKYTKRYFVDRDYTDNSNIPNTVCVTDGYAIENYYLTDSCVSKILENEFKINRVDNKEVFDKCILFYHDQHAKFEEGVLLFNAWYCCLHEDKQWAHTGVYLEDKFPSRWMECNVNRFYPHYSLTDIYAMYDQAPMIKPEVVAVKEDELRQKGWYYMRGKYEIQFLYIFLKYLHDEPKRDRVYTVQPCKIPFEQNTMISTFCQYADVPESLKSYIKQGCVLGKGTCSDK